MSATADPDAAEDVTDDLSEDEVMSVVRKASDRLVNDLERKTPEGDIDTDDYRILLMQDDPRAMMKAYEKAEEDGIQSQFKRSFENVVGKAVDDPAGWFQVLITASLAA